MGVKEVLARQPNHPCAKKDCGKVWRGDHQWITCWCCPGAPLAFCREHGRVHFATPECQAAHGPGAEGALSL